MLSTFGIKRPSHYTFRPQLHAQHSWQILSPVYPWLSIHGPPSMCTHGLEQALVLCAHADGTRLRNEVQLQQWEAMEARKANISKWDGEKRKGTRRTRCLGLKETRKLGCKVTTPCWHGQIQRLQTKPQGAQPCWQAVGPIPSAPWHLLPLVCLCSPICIHVYVACTISQGHWPFRHRSTTSDKVLWLLSLTTIPASHGERERRPSHRQSLSSGHYC